MQALPEYPPSYFLKFSEKPVDLIPYDPSSVTFAQQLVTELDETMSGLRADVVHSGSTRLGIIGKGEVELVIYTEDSSWSDVLNRLTSRYGKPGRADDTYARFNGVDSNREFEVIALSGYRARVDKALTQHLLDNPDKLREYERIKRQYAYSYREY